MLQALQELRTAKIRTALITITITLIALMITFLSALTQGLSHESVSALKAVAKDDALVLNEGTSTLSASHLDDQQVEQLENLDAIPLMFAHDKIDTETVAVMNWERDDNPPSEELYFDHQSVIWSDITPSGREFPIAGMLIPEHEVANVKNIDGVQVLEGVDRWKASGAYAGEQLSLTLMIVMLYVICTIITGAFFVVWTMQRLQAVSVLSALGASRKVLILQALLQAIVVTVIGVILGAGITVGLIFLIGDALPAVISVGTIIVPSLLISISALIGALLSLIPILRIDPKTALELL